MYGIELTSRFYIRNQTEKVKQIRLISKLLMHGFLTCDWHTGNYITYIASICVLVLVSLYSTSSLLLHVAREASSFSLVARIAPSLLLSKSF